MNDDFLSRLKAEPPPDYARALRLRLRRIEASSAPPPRAAWHRRWAPALAGAGALATVVVLLSVPSVRAAAQGFLELFRARHFVAVPLDSARLDQLRDGNIDIKTLVAEHVEVLKEPGEPRPFATIEEAGREADLVPKLPTFVARGYTTTPTVQVRGEGHARLTGSTAKLQAVLDVLGIDDVEVPRELDGAAIDVRMPAAVVASYGEKGAITLVQSRSPEVALPPGTDLRQLGEIALRVTGMSAAEAAQFAQSVDWNSTLLVPVPAAASQFREVEVQGTKGLLVTVPRREGQGGRRGDQTMILWSDGETVYALSGGASQVDLLAMANSLR